MSKGSILFIIMETTINYLISELNTTKTTGLNNQKITGLAYDSRKVKPGFLFFALPGLHVDGNSYIPQAIKNGAVAIIYQGNLDSYKEEIAYIQVENSRLSMSPISARFYDNPSKKIVTIGVTGTEGKSTTVYLIYQLLKLAGIKAGFFSTVMSDTGKGEEPNPEHQTTPEAPAVQEMLAKMVQAGYEYAVVESSSHGLSLKTSRLADIYFDCGVMTNVTSEHLEFHGTHEQYKSDKANLFRALAKDLEIKNEEITGLSPEEANNSPKNIIKTYHTKTITGETNKVPVFGIVNCEDPASSYFAKQTNSQIPVFGFAFDDNKTYYFPSMKATNVKTDTTGDDWTLKTIDIENKQALKLSGRSNLPGTFNLYNIMATLQIVHYLTNISVETLFPLTAKLLPVTGRMTLIDEGQTFKVLVDYAHTPSSFETIFPPLREQVKGKMICLFGSGGERDTKKRPEQGKIAAKYCDIIILTDEDPRGEDSVELLKMIAKGCPERTEGSDLFIIPDRPTAIRRAFSMANKEDLVLLLGKGHENSIIYKDYTMPYDEIAEAKKALKELIK